jgi:hypothetical protein
MTSLAYFVELELTKMFCATLATNFLKSFSVWSKPFTESVFGFSVISFHFFHFSILFLSSDKFIFSAANGLEYHAR